MVSLYQTLEALDPKLKVDFDKIRADVERIWLEQFATDFTEHGLPHIRGVENNLDKLAASIMNSPNPLNSQEIFVLLSACYLHDIGMQLTKIKEFRENHAELTYKLIIDNLPPYHVNLTFDDETTREVVARVARGHWTDFMLEMESKNFIGHNVEGRTKLLAALLCIADLLDISPERDRHYNSSQRLQILPPVSELHHLAHFYVQGCTITTNELTGDYTYSLKWKKKNYDVVEISDWLFRWLDSQWIKISPVLNDESGGQIRWSQPWFAIKFDNRDKLDPIPDGARRVLAFEKAEQQLIDRAPLISSFLEAFHNQENKVYILEGNPHTDSAIIAKWLEAYFEQLEDCVFAKSITSPIQLLDELSLMKSFLKQWNIDYGKDLNLQTFEELLNQEKRGLVLQIYCDRLMENIFLPIIKAFLDSQEKSKQARVVSLIVNTDSNEAAQTLRQLDGYDFVYEECGPYLEHDVLNHISDMGYDEATCELHYSKMKRFQLTNSAALVHTYIDVECSYLRHNATTLDLL